MGILKFSMSFTITIKNYKNMIVVHAHILSKKNWGLGEVFIKV